MDGMTTKQIAETCGVDVRTVQRWVSKAADKMSSVGDKMSSAGHGKDAGYTLEEVIEIVRAGGRHTLADLLQQNAADSGRPGLPNGAQLHELRRLVETGVLYPYHVRALLGFDVEQPVTAKEGQQYAHGLVEDLRKKDEEKAERAAAAARKNAIESIRRKRERDERQNRIDFGE